MSESVKSESTTNIDETEVPAAAAEQSNNDIVLNEDCGDLNADNQTEGVLVSTIDNEFNAESTEESTSKHQSHKTNNNINICNSNENENNDDSILVGVPHDESGIYDDVMTAPNISASQFDSELTGPNQETHESEHNNSRNESNSSKSSNVKSQGYTKRVSCYVGNLTWWTSDKDLTEAITDLNVTDLIEIKFYENKINGQSKGFAMVTCGSDQSFRTLMDRLPKREINGQQPIVTAFSRHYFNQFEEQARKDMPSMNNNNSNDNHHNNYHSNNNSRNDHANSHHHHNSVSTNMFQNQMMNRSIRFTSNGNGVGPMPGGLLGQGPRGMSNNGAPNGMAHQRPGLVGNYQPRNGQQNNMNNGQQSIMGNPNMINNTSRPNFNGNSFNNSNSSNQRPGFNPNNQSSLLGNRPALVPTPNGLLPMRPGINPALVGNNGPIGQGVGLLNNPRMGNMNNQSNLPGMQRDWDRSPSTGPINSQFNNLPHQQNGSIQQNPMLLMNQNQNSHRMGQGSNSFPYNNNNPGIGGPSPPQNGILPNPPHPFQGNQPNQTQNQPNFQHPHSSQHNFNPQMNQQSPLMNNQMQGQHLMSNGSITGIVPGMPQQSHLGGMPNQNQMSLIQQENNYQHTRSGSDYQQQQQGQSPLLGHQQQLQQLQQNQLKLSDIEFQEAFEKNRIVSSSAITRALQDASIGQYPSAMETLITAMSLIKQSKIAHDDRCKLFIISLEDTKKSIEDKYYGSGRNLSSGSVDGQTVMMNSGHVRSNSRDRERIKRSRSRDSRDRRDRDSRDDRDRDRNRDRSERSDRESRRRAGEKHHRSHRERSSRDRSRDRRTVVVPGMGGMDGMSQAGDYYEEPVQSSRYHRSRH